MASGERKARHIRESEGEGGLVVAQRVFHNGERRWWLWAVTSSRGRWLWGVKERKNKEKRVESRSKVVVQFK
jgi:hypothetical protein